MVAAVREFGACWDSGSRDEKNRINESMRLALPTPCTAMSMLALSLSRVPLVAAAYVRGCKRMRPPANTELPLAASGAEGVSTLRPALSYRSLRAVCPRAEEASVQRPAQNSVAAPDVRRRRPA